uniref:Aa_trans domain-containing protein n=1 Tax=Panagrellus redivivus TaxID=6233 RepID=A0A7E4VWX5_PANRE
MVILSLCASTPTAISLLILPAMVATFGIAVGIAFIVGGLLAIVISWSAIMDVTTKVSLASLTEFLKIRFGSQVLKTVGTVVNLAVTALYVAVSTVVCAQFFGDYKLLVIIAVGIAATFKTVKYSTETIVTITIEGFVSMLAMVGFIVNVITNKENWSVFQRLSIDYLNTTLILPASIPAVLNTHAVWLALIGGILHGIAFFALNETTFYRFKLLLTPQHCRLAIAAVSLTHFFIGFIALVIGHIFALNGITIFHFDVSILSLSPLSMALLTVSVVSMALSQISNFIAATATILEPNFNKELMVVTSDSVNFITKESKYCLQAFAGGMGLVLTLTSKLFIVSASFEALATTLLFIAFCMPVIDQKGANVGFIASIVTAVIWIVTYTASLSDVKTQNLSVFWKTDFVVGTVIGMNYCSASSLADSHRNFIRCLSGNSKTTKMPFSMPPVIVQSNCL